ncbi:MAG: hypothetical protein U9R06_01025 [Patescibacteria group bacterium]|nr:hypothetical protein [Patescibacteria group bacterium]
MLFAEKLYNLIYSAKQKISDYFFDFFSYLFFKVYLFTLLIINIFLWLAANYINKNIDSEKIALHYNVDFGINLIGHPKKVYIIPLLGIIFIILNLLILFCIRKNKDRIFIAHILLACALASNLILLVAITTVYLINFR